MLRNKLNSYGDETLKVPCHLHAGKEILDRMVEYADHPALINADTGETLLYSQLAQQTINVALSLSRIGVGKGDVVCVCSEKRMEQMPTILGIFCSGGIFTPTDVNYGTALLLHRVKISKPKVVFCSPTAFDKHKHVFYSLDCVEKYVIYGDEIKDGGVRFKDFVTETADVEDFMATSVDGAKDSLMIVYSSGTTGLPKGVPMTHLGFLTTSVCIAHESFKYSTFLNTREWCYTRPNVCTEWSQDWDHSRVQSSERGKGQLQAIQKYKIKILQSSPAAVTALIKSTILDQYDVSSVEVILSSNLPLKAGQVEAVRKRFPKLNGVYQIYGMAEVGAICNELHAALGPRDGSVGTPSHGFVLKVVDVDTRQPLGPNQHGEICIKAPSLTPGYLGIDNRDHLDEEGFFKSGDVGYYDEDRYFYVINRIKELIKYIDYTIVPAEIESLLLSHPCVREVGVVGAPHEEYVEVATAFVALQPGREVAAYELTEYLNSQVTFRMKLAGGVRFVDKLPRIGGQVGQKNS